MLSLSALSSHGDLISALLMLLPQDLHTCSSPRLKGLSLFSPAPHSSDVTWNATSLTWPSQNTSFIHPFVRSFIHSLNTRLLSTYHVPSTALGSGHTAGHGAGKTLCPPEADVPSGPLNSALDQDLPSPLRFHLLFGEDPSGTTSQYTNFFLKFGE